MARATGHHGDARFTGEPAPCIGHVHGGGLVAHVNEVNRPSQCGVEEAHDAVARQREHAGHAPLFEGTDNDVGSSQGFGHVPSTPPLAAAAGEDFAQTYGGCVNRYGLG
jgi:hypothetical protein